MRVPRELAHRDAIHDGGRDSSRSIPVGVLQLQHGLGIWSKYSTLSQQCHTLLANEKTAAVAAELLNLVL